MMSTAGSVEGLIFGSILATIAIVLAGRQWAERSARVDALSPEDGRYFRHKDRIRFANSAILIAIATGIVLLGATNPRLSPYAQTSFAVVLLAVVLLVVLMVVLALVDWMSTGRYAVRHRRALAEERRSLLREELQHLAAIRPAPRSPFGDDPRP